ncbi:MAG: hypothetical protein AAF711_10890 [Planctomycetota bacterium]
MIRHDRPFWATGGSETSMRDDYYTAANDAYADYDQSEPSQEGGGSPAVLRLLRGRWHWAILLGVILASGGVYLGYNFERPEYTAWSTIKIKTNYGIAVDVTDLSQEQPYTLLVQAEMDRLYALDTAELAMQQPEWQEAARGAGLDFASMTPQDFSDSIDMDTKFGGDQTIQVQYDSEDPAIAQAGINALMEAYGSIRKQGQKDAIDENLQLLQDRKSDLELRQKQIRDQMRLIIPDSEYLTIKTRLTAKLGELANMEFKLGELELIIGDFLNPNAKRSEVTIKEMMAQDPDMIALLEQKKQLEDEYIYQTEILKRGETMASVVQVKRMIARVDRQILDLEASWLSRQNEGGGTAPVPQQVAEMMATYNALVEKVKELKAETNDLATRIAAVQEDEFELQQVIESIRDVDEEIFDYEKTEDLFAGNEQITLVEIGDKAPMPGKPSNATTRIQHAAFGGIGGMGAGFGLVMLIGLMDRRMRHVADTAADLPDTNVLGLLPTLPADMKDPEQADAAAHCVHHIRTLLQIGGSNRVFSITSPAAGSGKSSLATALGMSFAATGSRTLVIDADLVGAGISRRMGSVVHESLDTVIRQKGLINEADLSRLLTLSASRGETIEQLLIEEQLMSQEELETAKRLQLDTSLGLLDACAPGRLRSCVAATGIDQLFVLPVGRARPADASRLSPAAMRELVKQAREAFDIVLIDTGPVLGSLEASIAAAESDATVLIVSRGDHRSVAARSLEQLRSVRANVAGLVFNHALESDLAHTSYASLISQERRPDISARKRKLDKTRSARLGPLGTAVASSAEETSDDQSLMVHTNGSSNGHE